MAGHVAAFAFGAQVCYRVLSDLRPSLIKIAVVIADESDSLTVFSPPAVEEQGGVVMVKGVSGTGTRNSGSMRCQARSCRKAPRRRC